ncbi:MAG: AAA family ATPase [Clostridia bacterium]|nr:AAA family ATPase [Clostridia bacterium]
MKADILTHRYQLRRDLKVSPNQLQIRRLTINWSLIDEDSYLQQIEPIRHTNELSFHAPVTIFTGENGSGKSTLLEAIAIAFGFNPEGGTRNYRFSTYDSHSQLSSAISLVRSPGCSGWGYFFRAESFYNVATAEEEYSRTAKTQAEYHKRSHGESFLQMAELNMLSRGFYLLDEPEAALSPQRQLTLLAQIRLSVRAGSQFIIATHSPILTGFPEADILSFDGNEIHSVDYEDTESVKITRLFLQDRHRLLHALFEEED